MKKFTTLFLITSLLISMTTKAMEHKTSFKNPAMLFVEQKVTLKSEFVFNRLIRNAHEETIFRSVKKTLNGLTNYQLGKKIKLKIITPGPFAKYKVALGDYPECYPARFSMKLYFSF